MEQIAIGVIFIVAVIYLLIGSKVWLNLLLKIREDCLQQTISAMPILLIGWPFYLWQWKKSLHENQTTE